VPQGPRTSPTVRSSPVPGRNDGPPPIRPPTANAAATSTSEVAVVSDSDGHELLEAVRRVRRVPALAALRLRLLAERDALQIFRRLPLAAGALGCHPRRWWDTRCDRRARRWDVCPLHLLELRR
jgi:hypothetical protein